MICNSMINHNEIHKNDLVNKMTSKVRQEVLTMVDEQWVRKVEGFACFQLCMQGGGGGGGVGGAATCEHWPFFFFFLFTTSLHTFMPWSKMSPINMLSNGVFYLPIHAF